MNLAIVGSRDYNEFIPLCNIIGSLIDINSIDCIVSGGAIGTDKLAERFCIEYRKQDKIFLPNEEIKTNAKFAIRNQKIVDNCDELVAFWDGKSTGTAMTIEFVKKSGKPHHIVLYKKKIVESYTFNKENGKWKCEKNTIESLMLKEKSYSVKNQSTSFTATKKNKESPTIQKESNKRRLVQQGMKTFMKKTK